MFLKIVTVISVGIVAAMINIILFNKKIRPPKIKKDEYGRYLDLGILKEFIASIVAATIVALPIISYVPIISLIISCSVPAIAGSNYIKTVVDKYVQFGKEELEKELSDLERRENPEKKMRRFKND